MKKGIPISPGVAVARAYCMTEVPDTGENGPLDAASLSSEISRFNQACAAAAEELDRDIARVAKQVGDEQAAIFRAHRVLLRDPALAAKVKKHITEKKVDAITALRAVLDEYSAFFSQVTDPYLQDRMADLRDVVGRILTELARTSEQPTLDGNEPIILVAPEILPSQALTFDRKLIAGILTEAGGQTGHAAILARSLGIPAVSGVSGILHQVATGDLIALDGREGHVYLHPGPEVQAAYRKLQREYVLLSEQLVENRDQEAISADGVSVELLANVNSPADARLAVESGAVGIGLYRTEYLFLTHGSPPDEEEQLAVYREVIEAAPNRTVTIRTLDLGGDKHVPYLGDQRETNPFMGFRSIRLSTAYPELFQTQLRAILRAGHHGRISMLFPMVSTLEEVQQIKRVVNRTKLTLQRAGVPHGADIPLGIMIEVPAAALCIDELLSEVDFVSIGSNDLIQYLMAADRDNPRVAHLCEPFSPALLRLLNQVITACNQQEKPVTVCGEMAGLPRCFLALFGMGLTRLSMSPAFVPSIKELVRHCTLEASRHIAWHVLRMQTATEIRAYLTRKLHQIWPEAVILDTRK
jgi:phosphotransferase system enzyme I (PtsI)